jgi:hypothetical protein
VETGQAAPAAPAGVLGWRNLHLPCKCKHMDVQSRWCETRAWRDCVHRRKLWKLSCCTCFLVVPTAAGIACSPVSWHMLWSHAELCVPVPRCTQDWPLTDNPVGGFSTSANAAHTEQLQQQQQQQQQQHWQHSWLDQLSSPSRAAGSGSSRAVEAISVFAGYHHR